MIGMIFLVSFLGSLHAGMAGYFFHLGRYALGSVCIFHAALSLACIVLIACGVA